MNEEHVEQTPEYEFNLSEMKLTDKLVQVHQRGNFIVGVTEHGVKFRQHIPAGKLLTKKGDSFVLRDRVVA